MRAYGIPRWIFSHDKMDFRLVRPRNAHASFSVFPSALRPLSHIKILHLAIGCTKDHRYPWLSFMPVSSWTDVLASQQTITLRANMSAGVILEMCKFMRLTRSLSGLKRCKRKTAGWWSFHTRRQCRPLNVRIGEG